LFLFKQTLHRDTVHPFTYIAERMVFAKKIIPVFYMIT
jgi:hypothetical protein